MVIQDDTIETGDETKVRVLWSAVKTQQGIIFTSFLIYPNGVWLCKRFVFVFFSVVDTCKDTRLQQFFQRLKDKTGEWNFK